jgi:hypothetical protein
MLSICDMLSSHSSTNIANYLSTTLRDFLVIEVDYFITNNTINNNIALEVLIGI